MTLASSPMMLGELAATLQAYNLVLGLWHDQSCWHVTLSPRPLGSARSWHAAGADLEAVILGTLYAAAYDRGRADA